MKNALLSVLLCVFAPFTLADRKITVGFEEQLTSGTSTYPVTSCTVGITHEIQSSVVHSGTYALRIQHNSVNGTCNANATLTASDTSGTYVWRVYFRTDDATPDVDQTILSFNDSAGSTPSQRLQLLTTGVLRMNNGPTSTSSDGSTTLVSDTWYRIEAEVLLSDTVGTVTVRLDGATEISMTGIDTLETNLYRFHLGAYSGNEDRTNNTYYDDIAINDETGSFQTSWPGAGNIAIVTAASNDTVTWTNTGANCSGTSQYDCVDDIPGSAYDDTSGYNDTASVQTDRFNITTIPSEVPASADITVLSVYGKLGGSSTTGTNTARLSLWDDSGTETNGSTAAYCDTTTWGPVAIYHSDAGTKTKADIQNYDIGYEPVSLNQTCRATALWMLIEWAPGCNHALPLMGAGCS